ncbi:acyl-CoA N-acyltransferase [Melampsora americana]|nr:acyl-CoA N-acyltransferase [Melampsora americana]
MRVSQKELASVSAILTESSNTPGKRKRTTTEANGSSSRRNNGKESSYASNLQQIKLVKIDTVIFGMYEIKPWYSSPYILDDSDQQPTTPQTSGSYPTDQKSLSNNQKKTASNLNSMRRLGNGRFIKKKKTPKSQLKDSEQTVSSQSVNVDHANSQDLTNDREVLPKKPASNARRRNERPRSGSLSSLSSSIASDYKSDPQRSIKHSPISTEIPDARVRSPRNPMTPQATSRVPTLPQNGSEPRTSNPIKLFVCDGCFQYLLSCESYLKHKKLCQFKHPPGRKVYQRGARIIWEVDGSEAKLYCQCLCLFGKLFIDHKYIFFDVEGFHFYILTEATSPIFDHVLGFFSKEKISYDGYNLACIVTFPPYQKKGYGTLLIEFSYELDRYLAEQEDRVVLGTPERPLSELGAKGYLAFWTSVLVRYFRSVFKSEGYQNPSNCSGMANGQHSRSTRAHALETEPSEITVSLKMNLEEISRATQLRPDDAAFALFTSGFTQLKDTSDSDSSELIVITPELVEEIAKRTRTREAVLDRQYVLLDSEGPNE